MGGDASKPGMGSWHGVHTVLKRGIDTIIAEGAKAGEAHQWKMEDLKDFMYHMWVTMEEHHEHEDLVFFPVFRKHVPEAAQKLHTFSQEHEKLAEICKQLEGVVGPRRKKGKREPADRTMSKEDLAKALQLWEECRQLLYPHFDNEINLVTATEYAKIPPKEAEAAHQQVLAAVQKESDAKIRLCINWYSLNEAERKAMFGDMPWFLTGVLIAKAWHSDYAHLIPFLPHYPKP